MSDRLLFAGNMKSVPGFSGCAYNSALGRFISPDSMDPDPANPQALNRYGYTLNNSLKFVDPSGHWSWDTSEYSRNSVHLSLPYSVSMPTASGGVNFTVSVGTSGSDFSSLNNWGGSYSSLRNQSSQASAEPKKSLAKPWRLGQNQLASGQGSQGSGDSSLVSSQISECFQLYEGAKNYRYGRWGTAYTALMRQGYTVPMPTDLGTIAHAMSLLPQKQYQYDWKRLTLDTISSVALIVIITNPGTAAVAVAMAVGSGVSLYNWGSLTWSHYHGESGLTNTQYVMRSALILIPMGASGGSLIAPRLFSSHLVDFAELTTVQYSIFETLVFNAK